MANSGSVLNFGSLLMRNRQQSQTENRDPTVSTAVNGKHYQWQLFVGNQWLPIRNDHVIEMHYCQPGAQGISINTNHGKVFIDFDQLKTVKSPLQVQRVSLLPPGQEEDMVWYFRSNRLWQEYGSQIQIPQSGAQACSITSEAVERQFSANPQGTISFTVGTTAYTLDLSSMTQKNCSTGTPRKVRRRPRFITNLESVPSSSVPPSPVANTSYLWEFMEDGDQWIEYQAQVCSLDSDAIEKQHQLNQQGQLHFTINSFSYTLDFASMNQTNKNTGTRRAVRRSEVSENQENIGVGATVRWQFKDIGVWRDYTSGQSQCSVTSQDIELQFQQNPSGTLPFTTKNFNYELNFSAMNQRNLSTNTTRAVRRLWQRCV